MTKPRLCLLAVIATSALSCQPESLSPGASAVTRYRALVYTKSFATRFQLPVQAGRELGAGVLAIAIRVNQEPNLTLMCSLDLYLDNSIPFAYPPGTQGRSADMRPELGPLFFARKLHGADLTAQVSRFSDQRILYRSVVYDERQRKGVLQSGPVDAFYRELLPGLNVVEYTITCDALDPVDAPAEIWLLRAGHDGTELIPTAPSDNVAYRIAVPTVLLNEAADATRWAAKQPVHMEDAPLPQFTIPK